MTPSGESVPTSVPNYLVPSILVTLCCCLPGGIASIIYAVQANNKAAAGDLVGGAKDAKTALTIMLVSAGLGLLVNLGVFGLQLLAIFANQ